jgi:putative tricarboxylic transport membrane protein
VILGPIAESQLNLALTIAGGHPMALVSSPVSVIIVALTVMILGMPLWHMWKDRRRAS